MTQNDSIAAVNERLVRQINQQARQDPKSPYAGKLVALPMDRLSSSRIPGGR